MKTEADNLDPKQKDQAKIQQVRLPNKITDTQFESWNLYKDSPQRKVHEQSVLDFLTGREANNLQCAKSLRLAINVITRATNTLRKKGLIEITCKKPCTITGQNTQHYSRTVIKPTATQSDLFRLNETNRSE